ncbi:nischarin isoform X2 [Scophthalmus maximus]|uniref:nischarin isoform X2 n=1 Tax=Scophthalmus maximus TaxID=52904 RepID=UPI001FA8A7F6|nr:nischarin isoform X2 [Scophthalmus maximus]
MESAPFPEEAPERRVSVVGSELVDNYTVYIIEVMDGEHRWTVKHRYSDFHELHEKLTAEKNVDRRLLPPKKILGKNSKSLVERRQIELELYLQTLLQLFPQATPAPLACFLHFHLYEINGITAALAEELFHKGEQLLQAGEVFSLSPLQLYSVSQQLRLAKPTCCNGDAKTDLGHILDFTCRLRYLKISGTSGPVGTSNIRENSLPFDLSVFKSLLQIEISECSSRQIRGLSSLRSSLVTMSIHHSTETMMSILVPESSEFSQWEPEGAESGCPVTAIIPVWRNMTTLDMSRNCVSTIDSSVKLIREVEFLDLSHNQLTSVENLQYLYNLVHVDLSYNSLRVLEAAHTRLGNIKTLSLAGNQLERLTGLTKLYSLVNLDLSHNQLAQLEEIRNIGSLPCLEKLNLSSNPMCIIPDYRTKVLAQFGDRAAEVCLDGDVTTEKELDTVEVLKAIQKAKEVKDRMSSGNKKISEETRLSAAAPPPPPPHLSSSPPCSSSSSTSCCSSSAVAPPAVTSSSSSSSSFSSSCPTQQAVCPSQVTSREEAAVSPSVLPPVDAAPPPESFNTHTHLLSAEHAQKQQQQQQQQQQQPAVSLSEHTHCGAPSSISAATTTTTAAAAAAATTAATAATAAAAAAMASIVCCVCSSSSSQPVETSCPSCSATWCPLLPSHLLALSSSSSSSSSSNNNKDFTTQLSQYLCAAMKEEKMKNDEQQERKEEKRSEVREVPSHVESTEVGSPSPGSRDGYFEMGLDDSVEESVCSSSSTSLATPPPPPAEEPGGHQGELRDREQEEVHISRVLWCYCLQVEQEVEVEQRRACLVLTDQHLGLLHLTNSFTWTNQDADPGQSPPVKEVLSSLQMNFLLPYSQLRLSCGGELPDCCLAFGLQSGPTRWYFFSEAEQLRQTRAELRALIQAAESPSDPEPPNTPQLLPRSLINSWELEESQGAKGGFPAHLLPSSSSSAPDTHSLPSDIISQEEEPGLPSLLFLTHRHLWVLKMGFRELAERQRSNADLHPSSSSSSCCRLVRVPLSSVVLHPRERAPRVGDRTSNTSCPDPKHHQRRSHEVELLLGNQRLLLLFPLSHDRSSFLGELSQRRASLEGLKMLALPQTSRPCPHRGEHTCTQECFRPRDQCCCPSTRKSHHSSSWDSSHLQLEENQPSPHLLAGLTPGLKLLAGLRGEQLLAFFHRYIALSEAEEVRQVLWLSVVLYKSPEAELTCCLLLSTDTIYFLLEDSASTLAHHSVLDITDSGDTDVCLCCCLSIRLSELQSVNVGLFDQYFRVVGRSADHIVCCLSRDSYGTGVFLQELMSALSLQQHLPPPEPSDQDFYSQFTSTNTGKMQNYELVHSSRVKFIYPSEEEMGDLTFIVAERKTPASAAATSTSRSFNVLLYLLVFQVQMPNSLSSQASSSSSSGLAPSPVLQPRTLILTSTDVFLLDEDYISHPLPDFAKEPPSRERYQLREARRIRDLDRVLLGYQTYPQALTLVFDDLPGPDLLCHLTMDHFAAGGEEGLPRRGGGCGAASGGAEGEVQWCVFVPGADSRERLISLLARQWEALCSRELPVELTG